MTTSAGSMHVKPEPEAKDDVEFADERHFDGNIRVGDAVVWSMGRGKEPLTWESGILISKRLTDNRKLIACAVGDASIRVDADLPFLLILPNNNDLMSPRMSLATVWASKNSLLVARDLTCLPNDGPRYFFVTATRYKRIRAVRRLTEGAELYYTGPSGFYTTDFEVVSEGTAYEDGQQGGLQIPSHSSHLENVTT